MIGTRIQARRTKSPYPASALKSAGCGLAVCLALMLPFDVQATDEEAAWRISGTSSTVRYTAHGTAVHGHQFGFVKVVRQCNVDLLWLSWSSINPEVKKLIGSKMTFLIDVDGTKSEMAVKLATAFTLTRSTTIAVFTNFHVGPEFFELLGRSEKIEITIGGPRDAKELFDVPVDIFALAGFEAARRQAKKACEADRV